MLGNERRVKALALINTRGMVTSAELVERLGVSDMTIRRDLAELERQGHIHKVHGGAVSLHAAAEPQASVKMSTNIDIKQRIAKVASQRVIPHEAIALTAGSTCTYIAQEIAKHTVVTAVTNGLHVVDPLYRGGSAVQLTGGTPTPSAALVGPLAQRSWEGIHVNTAFVGVHGVSLENGLTTPNLEEAAINRMIIASAETVIAVFDHSKLDLRGLTTFATWADIDVVITDDGITDEALSTLQELTSEVILVPATLPRQTPHRHPAVTTENGA